MLTAVLVDDNEVARQNLSRMLEDTKEIIVVGEAGDGLQGLEVINKTKPKIVFLDIDMPEINGLELAKQLQDLNPHIFIVFITVHKQYAIDAFELNTVDYLLKPFEKKRLYKTLERIKERLVLVDEQLTRLVYAMARTKKINVLSETELLFIDIDNIIFIEKEMKKTIIHTYQGKIYTNESIQAIQEKLKNYNFFRVHKSFLINLEKVKKLIPRGSSAYSIQFENYKFDALLNRSNIAFFKKLFS